MSIPPFGLPVEMYLGSTFAGLQLGVMGMSVGPQGAAATYAPLAYGGALYQVVQTVGQIIDPAQLWVLQSLDNGATWSVLDQANSPNRGVFTVFASLGSPCVYDGANTLIFAYNIDSVALGGPIQLKNFDLATGLWGLVYGVATAPSTREISAVYLRSDGSLIAFFERALILGQPRGVRACVFQGGLWGAPFNCDTNITAGQTANVDIASVYDPNTGTVHFFVPTLDAGFNHFTLYQQVRLNNTLGPFHNFATTDFGQLVFGENNPIIVGNNLLWGIPVFGNAYATLLVGTPIANPVFSVMPAPGVDPVGSGGGPSPLYAPFLCFDGSAIWGIYIVTTGAGAQELRVVQTLNITNPLLGWSGRAIYNNPTTPAFYEFPSIAMLNGRLVATFLGPPLDLPSGGGIFQPTMYFLGAALAQNGAVVIRGVKRFRVASKPDSFSDAPYCKPVKRAV